MHRGLRGTPAVSVRSGAWGSHLCRGTGVEVGGGGGVSPLLLGKGEDKTREGKRKRKTRAEVRADVEPVEVGCDRSPQISPLGGSPVPQPGMRTASAAPEL